MSLTLSRLTREERNGFLDRTIALQLDPNDFVWTEADAHSWTAVVGAAFQSPPEVADQMMPSLAFALDPNIALVIGSAGGVDVSAVGYSRSGPTAVLWGTATLEEYRGRGYGEAVSRAALAHAAERGCVHAALRSGPKSIPLYERLGFCYVCQHRTYAYPGGAG